MKIAARDAGVTPARTMPANRSFDGRMVGNSPKGFMRPAGRVFELVIHDVEVGTEARIVRDGDLLVSRLFKEGSQAIQWRRKNGHIERADALRQLRTGEQIRSPIRRDRQQPSL